MIKVKLSIPDAPENINLSQFIGNNSNIFNNIEFHVNDGITEADFWFVLESTNPNDDFCYVPRGGFVFLSAETARPLGFYTENEFASNFLLQFDHVFSCHESLFPNSNAALPFLPWMINSNHGESIFATHERDVTFFQNLNSLSKEKQLSVICSAQGLTPEHRMRFRFVSELKSHFKDRLDWFGNGVQPLETKWEGLAPYKYSIAIENTFRHNVLSEKLLDCFLSLTFPIYWGSPSAKDMFPEKSIFSIDIFDKNGSIQRIEKLLEEDPYESILPSLVQAKNLVISDFNILSRISSIANGITTSSSEIIPKKFLPMDRKIFPRNRDYISKAINLSGSKIEKLAKKMKDF